MEKKIIKRDRILAYIGIFIFAVVAIAVTGYAFSTRSPGAFVAAIPTLVATYALFALKLVIDKKIETSALSPSKFNYFGFGYVFPLLAAAFVTFGLFVSVLDGIYYLTKLDSVYHVAIAALVVGVALFFIRLHVRFWYGSVEVFVGVFVAMSVYQSNSGKPTTSLFLGVLTAGVYLIVRGLDNVHQGWATDKLNKLIGDRLNSEAKKQIQLAEQLAVDQKRKEDETAKLNRREEEAARKAKQRLASDEKMAAKARSQQVEKDRRAKVELDRQQGEALARRVKEVESARMFNTEARISQKSETEPDIPPARLGVAPMHLGKEMRGPEMSRFGIAGPMPPDLQRALDRATGQQSPSDLLAQDGLGLSSARQAYEEHRRRENVLKEVGGLAAFPKSAQDEVKHIMKYFGRHPLDDKEQR